MKLCNTSYAPTQIGTSAEAFASGTEPKAGCLAEMSKSMISASIAAQQRVI